MLINGEELWGRIRFIASTGDPATRTFRVELEIDNPDYRWPEGVTAEVRLPTQKVLAHLVSPAILTLSERGDIGVKVIEKGDTVSFRSVQIVEQDGEGVWLGGLPDEVTLIVVGQDFVRDGQRVRTALENAESDPLQAARQ